MEVVCDLTYAEKIKINNQKFNDEKCSFCFIVSSHFNRG